MNGMWAWFAVGGAAMIVEVASPHFGSILIAVAALASAALAAAGFGLEVQLPVFAGVSLLLVTLLRSRIVHKFASAPGVPSRTERLVGSRGRVTEPIDPHGGGRVTVEGVDWAAESETAIAAGASIVVEGAHGIKLIVKPAPGE